MLCYDVLVVGAGPAGTSAAGEAAKQGARVLLVERKRTVGQPVQCAEFIPGLLPQQLEIRRDYIIQSTRGMRTCLPDGEITESLMPGYIIHRGLFDKMLAAEAIGNGADILLQSRVSREKREYRSHQQPGQEDWKSRQI